jgi:outer membrane protein OmpA-like peptidoglycan-associated protein
MINRKLTKVSKVVKGHRTTEKTTVYETERRFEKFLLDNFFKIFVTALTGFGLLAIYAYHFGVEYYPVFDIKSAASMIFAVAYTGLGLLLAMSLLILLPTLLMFVVLNGEPKPASRDEAYSRLAVYFTLAFLAFLGICWALLLWDRSWWSVLCVPPLLLFLALFVVMVRKKTGLKERIEHGFMLVQFCALQFLPMYLFVLILAQPHSDGIPREFDPAVVAAATFGVDLVVQMLGFYVVAAWIYRVLPWQHKTASPIAASLVVFFVLVVGGHPEFIGARIANMTKFGNFYATEITLSEDGCKTVDSSARHACLGKQETGLKVCGAFVVSRIGSESYLKLYEDDAEPEQAKVRKDGKNRFTRSVFLPSKEVAGMTLHDVKGIAMPTDAQLVEDIALCRIRNRQVAKTILPLGGESFFGFGQYALAETGKKMLAALAEKLITVKDEPWTVTVQGYADQIGQEQDNLALSGQRAAAVRAQLTSLLPADLHTRIMTPSGSGSTRLRKTDADCPEKNGKQQRIECLVDNRRVEIAITSPGAPK